MHVVDPICRPRDDPTGFSSGGQKMNERGSRKIPVTERQFLWVQDDDKGEVTLHVGPTMVSPTAADRVVIDDG